MNFLVSGASGLIGSSLTRFLEVEDHNVKRLSRSKSGDSDADLRPECLFASLTE